MTPNQRIKTLSDYHRLRHFSPPLHPLVSLVDLAQASVEYLVTGAVMDFYSVCIKRSSHIKLRYGQQEYDFDSGLMLFMGPGQVFGLYADEAQTPVQSGWLLLFHPDLLWNTSLGKKIRQLDLFSYYVNEALFLSEREELIINGIIHNIQQEYQANIDKFSKQIIVSHIETLLNYAERFYARQFITRERSGHQILERLDKILTNYFNNADLIALGLPSVQYVADQLNLSSSYLGSLLRTLTGQNTQQHIHEKLIAKAKEELSTTDLSIREIAYALGFEHSQSFSKLFKTRTGVTPLEFRTSFN
ncbi:helix-turn-helix transcriptional regulator [Mucilaginibacter sp. 21P]|uniref:helix-turn-helix domain-containing protein n=1 Tax=Mucilaginibacter sp. 21P TaxID=2778902 RepID=UPI001C57F08F|nr:helix-turn-helix transcriptional regulator [Mucilaginibacter sp. 21P]QXV63962.1 helix-turn-helix transcriptional regulator [Mucilaginibacter sp. 21P]